MSLSAETVAVASAANAPRPLAHDIDGSKCRRCGIPYPQTGHLGCLFEGETLRHWYENQPEEIQKICPPTPETFPRFYRPNADRVVVKPDAPPEMSPSGLLWYPPSFLEDLRYRRPVKATVMAVGPGMLTAKGTRWPLASEADRTRVVPGARVLFHPQGGFEVVKVGPFVFMSLRDDFLIATIEEE